ncbi:MAG TPA: hypothetical protein VHZ07_20310 [Bryobacteraceae bacterium]|nr:hypothetical protein [Bryobacteraceae bacterium]
MVKSQIGPAALLGTVLAGGLAIKAASGEFGWLTTFIGVTLLLVLLSWDEQPARSFVQSIAYAAVIGFTFMLAWSWLFAYEEANRTYLAFPGGWYPIFWGIGFIIFVVVDRVRVGNRVPDASDFTPRPAALRVAAPTGSVFGIATPPPTPAAAPRTTSASILEETTIAAVYPPPTAPSFATAPPSAGPAPSVKEATIYVGLLGESRGALRPVRAADLGHNFYQILEEVPPGDEWQFTTGQVVRCQKKNLSTGKGLVAVEEAPRA